MKQIFKYLFYILILIYPIFPQNLFDWEDCTSGLEGKESNLDLFEDVLYLKSYLYILYNK